MLTLFHAPQTRSTSVLALLHELNALDRVEIRRVGIARPDGSGAPDPANPHPEKKVPYLTDGADAVRERAAIFAYLTERFPEAGMAPQAGEAARGRYLSWLAWYQGVVEPVMVLHLLGVSHPGLARVWRGREGITAVLSAALARGPYLLGDRYSAADLLCASPFAWFADFMPDDAAIRDWVARCQDRESIRWAAAQDAITG